MRYSIARCESSIFFAAIFLNFASILISNHNDFLTHLDSAVIFELLQASAVIHIPLILDGISELFVANNLDKCRKMSLFLAIGISTPNIVLLCIKSVFSLQSSIVQIFLNFLFLQIMIAAAGIYLIASNYFAISRASIICAFISPSFFISVGLNSLSHADLSTDMTSLVMTLSLLFSCLGLFGILKSFHLVFIRRSSIDPINVYCFSSCMVALFSLVVGTILLRIISLLSPHGMIVYVNGIPLLCTICILPVLMLEGRVMRQRATRNEVFYRYN